MKIAFVDVATNRIDAFEIATTLAESMVSDVTLVRFTSPEILKIPASCTRVLNEGASCAIVFATAKADESKHAELVEEKIIDVEIAAGKFVFTAIIFADEWRNEEKLLQIAEKRIAEMLEMALGLHKPGENQGAQPGEMNSGTDLPKSGQAMDMFTPPTDAIPETPPAPGEDDSSSRPLF